MDYVKKFLHIEGTIGQGAFGRVLQASCIQNQSSPFQPQQQNDFHTLSPPLGQPSPPISTDNDSNHNQRYQSPPRDRINKSIENSMHTYSLRKVTPTKRAYVNENISTTGQGPRYALKCVYPILKPQRLANELRHLMDLRGECNVVQMHTAHFSMGSLFIVMELIERDAFMDYVYKLNYEEIVSYMKNLLIALAYVHSKNIMHRDIKPANFLFNRKHKKFLLVDFGLAQTVRSSTRPPVPSDATPTRLSNNSITPSSIRHQQHLNEFGLTSVKTPPARRATALFPESIDNNQNNKSLQLDKLNYIDSKNNVTSVCLNASTGPTRSFQYIKLTPNNSPSTNNISAKRQLSDINNTNDCSQMLKKLRVSSSVQKEPVKLMVGVYESPITHTDSESKRNLINHKQQKVATPRQREPPKRIPPHRCDCRGQPKTCLNCMSRPEPSAPKSGTPGFKAPEILLRFPHQSTPIDIWSAGIIMLYLLSGHAPFFRDVEDVVGLAEIVTILGSQKVTLAARAIGIRLNIEPRREPMNLGELCRTIRRNSPEKRKLDIPDSAFDLLQKMLDPNPLTRITASDALKHPWFKISDETTLT